MSGKTLRKFKLTWNPVYERDETIEDNCDGASKMQIFYVK